MSKRPTSFADELEMQQVADGLLPENWRDRDALNHAERRQLYEELDETVGALKHNPALSGGVGMPDFHQDAVSAEFMDLQPGLAPTLVREMHQTGLRAIEEGHITAHQLATHRKMQERAGEAAGEMLATFRERYPEYAEVPDAMLAQLAEHNIRERGGYDLQRRRDRRTLVDDVANTIGEAVEWKANRTGGVSDGGASAGGGQGAPQQEPDLSMADMLNLSRLVFEHKGQ